MLPIEISLNAVHPRGSRTGKLSWYGYFLPGAEDEIVLFVSCSRLTK